MKYTQMRINLKILVDADACPNPIKEILFRASNRLNIKLILYANHPIQTPKSPNIQFQLVSKGFDMADDEIEKWVETGDLVITADVPLADRVVSKSAHAINPRGMLYTEENIKHQLQIRNFTTELRETGQIRGGGPKALSKKDLQAFGNALDAFLAKNR